MGVIRARGGNVGINWVSQMESLRVQTDFWGLRLGSTESARFHRKGGAVRAVGI